MTNNYSHCACVNKTPAYATFLRMQSLGIKCHCALVNKPSNYAALSAHAVTRSALIRIRTFFQCRATITNTNAHVCASIQIRSVRVSA